MTPPYARARWFALVVPILLLGGALGSQYLGGLHPCEMCIWQRWPHAAAIVLAALGLRVRSRWLVALAAVAIIASGAIGAFHAGVELGWWEGLTRCSTSVAGGSGADILADIMATPVVRCDQVQWAFLGLSMAAWNALISLFSGGLILCLLTRPNRR